MGRKITLVFLLCALLAVLSGCAAERLYPEITVVPQGYIAPTPTPEPADANFPEGSPEDEEDIGDEFTEPTEDPAVAQATPTMVYVFAGSTPMPLDPIDKPTSPPHQAISFTYQEYEALKLGIKFEGPAGWDVDDSGDDTYVLTEPASQQKDNYTASITLRAVSMNKQLDKSDMVQEVKGMLDTLGSTNYSPWEPSATAERTLMDEDGVYANYAGTLPDGTRVRGRVHVTCINNVLYSIEMSHPANYNTDYLQNHGKLRETMAIIK